MKVLIAIVFHTLFASILAFPKNSQSQLNTDNPLDVRDTINFEKSYDFVVIGGGSAGSVVASRLSEIRKFDVLLLEVGENENFVTDIPLVTATETSYDWNYFGEPRPGFCKFKNGVCTMARGKALGGSSVINNMVYTRGHRQDYDNWAALGNKGWDYNSVLKYFRKAENSEIPDVNFSSNRKEKGLLDVQHAPFKTFVTDTFLNSGVELGYNITNVNDDNGEDLLGFQRAPATLRRGRRCSASKAFLLPFQNRPNLHVSKKSLVTKILIDRTTKVAYGVEFIKNGVKHVVNVNNEVILSAGAIASPQLLMLSGVGPKEHLKSLNITVIQDLPVGQNYRDHAVFAPVSYTVTPKLPYPQKNEMDIQYLFDYANNHNGPYTVPGALETITFLQTKKKNNTVPDIEISCLGRGPKTDQIMLVVILLHPKSKGQILLASTDPTVQPKIDTNLLVEQEDVDTLRDGIRLALKIGDTESFRKIGAVLDTSTFSALCPNDPVNSDAFWNCAITYFGGNGYHSVGTCKMGPSTDPEAVVNNELLVHGVPNLRVADLSIAPLLVSGHTQAAATMIGEKAADLIKNDWSRVAFCNKCQTIWSKILQAIRS